MQVPAVQSCMNDNFRSHQKKTWQHIQRGEDVYFILWDTRASGIEEPGVHIPQDNVFSGRRYGSDGEQDESDRHLSREYIEYHKEQVWSRGIIQGHDVKMSNVSHLLLQMKTLYS